jgi:hypothetical protein
VLLQDKCFDVLVDEALGGSSGPLTLGRLADDALRGSTGSTLQDGSADVVAFSLIGPNTNVKTPTSTSKYNHQNN